jgi:DNA-binding transcriptional LysR family regulator
MVTRPGGADLGDLTAFLAVARAGGFREGARASGGSASSLSEAVRRLERLEPALGEVQAALDVVNRFRDRPAGRLRLNVPVSAARLVLPAIVPPFLAAYPDIQLEVVAEDGFVDVLAAGCDAGIRYDGRLEQDMIAVPIGPRRQRFATAAAVAGLGVIHLFEDWLRPHLAAARWSRCWRRLVAGVFGAVSVLSGPPAVAGTAAGLRGFPGDAAWLSFKRKRVLFCKKEPKNFHS